MSGPEHSEERLFQPLPFPQRVEQRLRRMIAVPPEMGQEPEDFYRDGVYHELHEIIAEEQVPHIADLFATAVDAILQALPTESFEYELIDQVMSLLVKPYSKPGGLGSYEITFLFAGQPCGSSEFFTSSDYEGQEQQRDGLVNPLLAVFLSAVSREVQEIYWNIRDELNNEEVAVGPVILDILGGKSRVLNVLKLRYPQYFPEIVSHPLQAIPFDNELWWGPSGTSAMRLVRQLVADVLIGQDFTLYLAGSDNRERIFAHFGVYHKESDRYGAFEIQGHSVDAGDVPEKRWSLGGIALEALPEQMEQFLALLIQLIDKYFIWDGLEEDSLMPKVRALFRWMFFDGDPVGAVAQIRDFAPLMIQACRKELKNLPLSAPKTMNVCEGVSFSFYPHDEPSLGSSCFEVCFSVFGKDDALEFVVGLGNLEDATFRLVEQIMGKLISMVDSPYGYLE